MKGTQPGPALKRSQTHTHALHPEFLVVLVELSLRRSRRACANLWDGREHLESLTSPPKRHPLKHNTKRD